MERTSGNFNGRVGENRERRIGRDCVGLPCGGGKNVRKRANKRLEEAGINIVHAQPVNSQPCREFSPSIARLSFHGRRLVRRPPLPAPSPTTATFLVVSPSPMSTGVCHHYSRADRHRHHRGPEQSPLRAKTK